MAPLAAVLERGVCFGVPVVFPVRGDLQLRGGYDMSPAYRVTCMSAKSSTADVLLLCQRICRRLVLSLLQRHCRWKTRRSKTASCYLPTYSIYGSVCTSLRVCADILHCSPANAHIRVCTCMYSAATIPGTHRRVMR